MDNNYKNTYFAYGLVVTAILIFVWELRHPLMQLDDAFISYRYARNFADGHGLVFNIGQRVEGYTNLLWVLLVALGLKLGFAAPIFGHWLCVATGVLLLWATYCYAALLLPRSARLLAALAPWLILSFNSFVHWTASGLEQGFFSALIILALSASLLNRSWLVLFLCILATLVRPEGVLAALVLLNAPWVCALGSREFSKWKDLLPKLMPAINFGIFVLLLTGFRWFYYGDIVPNTFHAKTGGLPFSWGVIYLERFFLDGPVFLLAGTLIAAVKFRHFRSGFILLLVFVLYVLAIRGDAFSEGRFMLPVLPIMIAGNLVAVHFLFAVNRFAAFGLFAATLLAVFFSLYVAPPEIFGQSTFRLALSANFPYSAKRNNDYIFEAKGLDETLRNVMLPRFRQANPPIHLIAAVGIGRIGYYGPEFEILDLVGLTDKTIAQSKKASAKDTFLLPGHQKTDSEYVLNRKPDLILIPKKDTPALLLPAQSDLWNNPKLKREYHWDDEIGGYLRNLEH